MIKKYKDYDVIVIKKNNKNSYVRISDKMEVVITTSIYSNEEYLKNLLIRNEKRIDKMLLKQEKLNNRSVHYRGQQFDRVMVSGITGIEIFENKILYASEKKFNEWYKKEAMLRFKNLLYNSYNQFSEKVVYPTLKLRQMKTRWGVCNRMKKTITLNMELMNYNDNVIQYVIIHELCHLVYPNHSASFWRLVENNMPDYKKCRKILKD